MPETPPGAIAPLRSAELWACGIGAWYPQLRRVSIRSVLLPLPSDFADYLVADGVVVPSDEPPDDDEDNSDIGVSDDASERSDAPTPALPASFNVVRRAIDEAIDKLGGAVLPKLNWSAPTDAAWVLGGSPKCTSSDDVLLLLQSSDRIAHDLTEAQRLCTGAHSDPAAGDGIGGGGIGDGCGCSGGEAGEGNASHQGWVLALRKWCELDPSREFRCFRGTSGQLLAACRRDRYNHHPQLFPAREATLRLLSNFGREHLPPWPAGLVWDAYIDRSQKVHLIDLAPFHESTDPILFSWDEIRRLDAAWAGGDVSVDTSAGVDASLDTSTGGAARHAAPTTAGEPTRASDDGAAVSVNAESVNAESVNAESVNAGQGLALSAHAGGGASGPEVGDGPDPAPVAAELRLVEEGAPLAPSASVYHGWPRELRELGQADLHGLVRVAMQAAAGDTD